MDIMDPATAKWIGVAGAAFLYHMAKHFGATIPGWVTRQFKKRAEEINTLDEREKEKTQAAEVFAKDAEIARLKKELETIKVTCEALVLEKSNLELETKVLRDAKLDLEFTLARKRVEEATGKHKALKPRVLDQTDKIDTERPRRR